MKKKIYFDGKLSQDPPFVVSERPWPEKWHHHDTICLEMDSFLTFCAKKGESQANATFLSANISLVPDTSQIYFKGKKSFIQPKDVLNKQSVFFTAPPGFRSRQYYSLKRTNWLPRFQEIRKPWNANNSDLILS